MDHLLKAFDALKEAILHFVEWLKEQWKEIREFFDQLPDPLPVNRDSWDWEINKERHQLMSQLRIKVQDQKWLEWERPWKSKKGQRR